MASEDLGSYGRLLRCKAFVSFLAAWKTVPIQCNCIFSFIIRLLEWHLEQWCFFSELLGNNTQSFKRGNKVSDQLCRISKKDVGINKPYPVAGSVDYNESNLDLLSHASHVWCRHGVIRNTGSLKFSLFYTPCYLRADLLWSQNQLGKRKCRPSRAASPCVPHRALAH